MLSDADGGGGGAAGGGSAPPTLASALVNYFQAVELENHLRVQ